MITEYPFDVPGNYVFDPNKIKVENGEASLKSLVYPDETFFADFKNEVAGRRGAGSMDITAHGDVTIDGEWLVLGDSSVGYIDIDANLNADSQQIGCIRWDYRPNYNVGPNVENWLFMLSRAAGDSRNRIYMRHRDAVSLGDLRLHSYDQVGALIEEKGLGAWGTTLGNIYNLELNFDYTAGVTRFFINGIQLGAIATGTGVRDANIGLLRFGSDFTATRPSQGAIRRIQYFSTVQHTSNFTNEIPRAEPTTYAIDNPAITTGVQAMDGLELFEAEIEKTGSDEIKHIINHDWFDTIWKDSNETYAESNLAATIETNKASLDLSNGFNVPVKSFLHSHDGTTTPKLKLIRLGYNFFIAPDADVNECMISARMDDIFQDLTDFSNLNAKLIVELEKSFQQGDRAVFKYAYPLNFDSDGYVEISIRETASVGKKVKFKIKYTGQDENGGATQEEIKFKDAIIPDVKSKKLFEITSIV